MSRFTKAPLSVLFWFRKASDQPARPAGLPEGDLYGAIYLRIAVRGRRLELGSQGVYCWKSEWDSQKRCIQRHDGDLPKQLVDNNKLAALQADIQNAYLYLVSQCHLENKAADSITVYQVQQVLKGLKSGTGLSSIKIPDLLNDWLQQQDKLYKAGRITRSSYRARSYYIRNLAAYLEKTNRGSYSASTFTERDMDELKHYLFTRKGYKPAYVGKLLITLKQVFVEARRRGLITDNPLAAYRISRKGQELDTTCLSSEQVHLLIGFDPFALVKQGQLTAGMARRLDQERDCLLFTCFTGMHDGDFQGRGEKGLQWQIKEDQYGAWVYGQREKTGEHFRVPLDPLGQQIIAKYGSVEALPKRSNQQRNHTLKLLGVVTGIGVKLTTKIGRKTFADRMLNELGYESMDVAVMLGHRDASSLKHYARVRNERLVAKFRPLQPHSNLRVDRPDPSNYNPFSRTA